MQRKKSVRSMIAWIIIIVICTFIAWEITRGLFPQPQFTVELSKEETGIVMIYTYHNQGTSFPIEYKGGNKYACDIPKGYWGKSLHIEFTLNNTKNRVITASVNDESINPYQIIHVVDFITSQPYSNTVVITTHEIEPEHVIVCCVIIAILLALCLIINREIKESNFGTLGKTLMCGGIAMRSIGKKGFSLALAGILFSCIISVGCDIDIIISALRLMGSGVDIIQYIATVDQRHQIQFLIWQYNLTMLLAYFLGTIPLQFGNFVPGVYHIGCYFFFKLLNGTLILITIISLLSFLINRGILAEKKCKSIFLWSFFNPLVFYIAVIFIQLDIFPACCLVIGCLSFAEKKTPVLAGTLIGIGTTCKMPGFLLIPPVLAMLFCEIMRKDKENRISTWKTVAATTVTISLCLVPMIKSGSPLALMVQYTPQTERVWWTTIQYAPEVFLLITPTVLICAMIADLVHMNLFIQSDMIALNCLYMFGAIVLLFSFSILSTPSTMIHCLAAFTLLNVFAKDNFQRLMISGLSILVVFEVMFSSIGDIAKLLSYLEIPYNFTILEQSLKGTDLGARLYNLLFSISHAAMLTYGVIFCKNAIEVLSGNVEGGVSIDLKYKGKGSSSIGT